MWQTTDLYESRIASFEESQQLHGGGGGGGSHKAIVLMFSKPRGSRESPGRLRKPYGIAEIV
jgi:hypothetical protein